MSAERFSLDTNVLIYAFDVRAGRKHRIAEEIVRRSAGRGCHLTLQALGEFYAASTRNTILTPAVAAKQVEDWLLIFPVIAASADETRLALALTVAGRASYWDALLVTTAESGGCEIVLSEDMEDGSRLGGVTVLNPFFGDTIPDRVEQLIA